MHNNTLHNCLVRYIHDRELNLYVKKFMRGLLVDIGCGAKPYELMIKPFVSKHVGIDHQHTLHTKMNIDIFGTAYKIPVKDQSFDSAISTAVLEHLEEPEAALLECFRVMKSHGYVIYSVPFIWHVHEEPRDFYRFSKYGIKYLFEKVGFEVVALQALSGFWVTFGQLFVYNLYRLNRGPIRWLRLIDFIGLVIQFFSFFLDKLDKSERWTWMYMVVARKP